MEKKYYLQLTEDEIDTLLMILRFVELHHPNKDIYKKDFSAVFNNLYRQLRQTELFKKE